MADHISSNLLCSLQLHISGMFEEDHFSKRLSLKNNATALPIFPVCKEDELVQDNNKFAIKLHYLTVNADSMIQFLRRFEKLNLL